MKAKDMVKMRENPCLVCGKTPSDIAHVKSSGSGGSMSDSNLISLCRADHQTQHRVGWKKFLEMNPVVLKELIKKGWTIDETHGRFRLINTRGDNGS